MEPVNSLAARDVRSVIHPFTDLAHHVEEGPLVLARGDGVYVLDEHGRRYLEGMAGLWCANLGFSEARLVEAAREQMSRLPTYHLFGGKSHGPAIALAERLLAMAPAPMSKALFTCSGSEANDTAIKLVRYYHHALGKPDKHKIISRLRAYHGVTLACASLSGLPHVHRDFGLPLPGILHTECPHHYRYALPGETEEAFATRLGGGAGAPDPARGPDTVGGFHRRADHGRGRRDHAARGLLPADPGGAREVRRAADRGRGDHRLRAHRRDVRVRALRHPAGPDHARQGSLGRLPADRRGADRGADLPGDAGAEPQDRHVRARLHLLGPPGVRGSRAPRAGDLRGGPRARARADHRAAFRRAHHGPDQPSRWSAMAAPPVWSGRSS